MPIRQVEEMTTRVHTVGYVAASIIVARHISMLW